MMMEDNTLKGSITKKLVMTYSAVLGVFLIITVFLLNITARNYLENTIVKNLHTESAIIEELYRERVTISLDKDESYNVKEMKRLIKSWFSDVKKLSGIGFASHIALVIRTDDTRYGIFTPGESQIEVNFRAISPDELHTKLQDQPFFFRITGDETPYFSVSRPLFQGNGATPALKAWIIAYTPVYELNRLVRDMNFKAAYAIGIALLVAAFLSYYLSTNISKPIKALKNHAERIAARHFNARVKINTGDEIESLGQAMNKIAGDLSDYDIAQKRFLQNVTHELKTPIMSIMGYAEGLRDGVIDNDEKALNVIIGECERLHRLVNEVLYLSKLETVEEFYSFKNEKLNEVLEEARDKVQSLVDSAGLNLTLELDANYWVNMDRDKILQALLNLLSNAVRYAKSSIVIETHGVQQGVAIMVRDDGPGMNEGELVQVFDRFYKGKKGSTGLGMTITKAIVEKHLGSITASSCPDGGALFAIILPLL